MLNQAAVLAGVAHDKVTATSRFPFRTPESPDAEALLVLSGIVGLYVPDTRGLRQFVALRFPGETILPGQRGRCGVWPLTDAELAISNPDAVPLSLWLDSANRALAIAHEWLAQGRAGKTERLAHLLCEIAVRGGHEDEIPNVLTQAQLADITGQTSVNVNRVFADLEHMGYISRPKGRIVFEDAHALRRLAGFNPAYLAAV